MSDESAADERESRVRSILKAITYRVTGTVTTAGVVYLVTADIGMALSVGAVEPLVKIAVYYVHERLWTKVPRRILR